MKFYKVNEQYAKYLATIDKKVLLSQNIIGIPLRMNELIYFLLYFCLDESDKDFYRKILLSNMFAVPYRVSLQRKMLTLRKY